MTFPAPITYTISILAGIVCCSNIHAAQIVPAPNQTGCPADTVYSQTNLAPNHDFSILNGGASPSNTPLSGGSWQTEAYYFGDNQYPADGSPGGSTNASIITTGHYQSTTLQWPFPGDPGHQAPALANFLYVNGNDKGGPFTAWQSTLTGLQPNTTYSFAAYVSNVVNPDLSGVHNPIIQLYADEVALGEPFDVPLDSVSDQGQDIWTRLEQTFTTGAGQTSVTLRLVDSATSSYGDDLAIAGLGVFACEPPYISLNLRAFLQGAYASSDGRMRDNLRQKSYLPLSQPYNDLANHYAGEETTTAAILATSGDDAPVDWVLVELRDKDDPGTRLAAAAALLQRDGDVADPQTNTPTLRIPQVTANSYYVALRHRNHLGVMTQAPLALSPTSTAVDFTSPGLPTAGAYARTIENNRALLWAGDANNNNHIIATGPDNDANVLLGAVLAHPDNSLANSSFILPGYRTTDLNLDGVSLYAGPANDINLLRSNVLLYPANTHVAGNYIVDGTLPE
ncbi:hypothetical protein VSS37_05555 [Candidatus Thiothrix sp. Deng01]|uniref:Fibronectin type-III domain-containing protein n=1 Tax=Candidatus Thiothrix phosphatis TaxID=3112415 RepID=A0ABU6CV14_9GAMM|nr:hypothetical protein [Candidatus Thiothrix sp. Deng01]MEB4590436.1 hypothetical protein [Candidatus Thiothrix sp. Deng01]